MRAAREWLRGEVAKLTGLIADLSVDDEQVANALAQIAYEYKRERRAARRRAEKEAFEAVAHARRLCLFELAWDYMCDPACAPSHETLDRPLESLWDCLEVAYRVVGVWHKHEIGALDRSAEHRCNATGCWHKRKELWGDKCGKHDEVLYFHLLSPYGGPRYCRECTESGDVDELHEDTIDNGLHRGFLLWVGSRPYNQQGHARLAESLGALDVWVLRAVAYVLDTAYRVPRDLICLIFGWMAWYSIMG
jgi:hypothetical protein